MSFLIIIADVSAKGAEFRLSFMSVLAIAAGLFIGAVPFGTGFFTFFYGIFPHLKVCLI